MIRTFSLRDVFLVQGLQNKGVQLDLEGEIIRPHSPLNAALTSHLPFRRRGAATYVIDERGKGTRVRGFAQTRDRPKCPEADIVYLSPRVTADAAHRETWERLVAYLAQAEGIAGIQRLFVKLAEDDSAAIDVFRHAGFGIYTQELLLRLAVIPNVDARLDDVPLRALRPEDAWGLHRLYCQTAPRLVQQTECMSCETWEAGSLPQLNGQRDESYVWERENEIVGYVRLIEGLRGHWLKLLLHPDVQDQADDLIYWSQVLLKDFPPRAVFSSVRAYDTPLQMALKRAEFQPEASLILLVKHTMRRVEVSERRWVRALERGVEPAISTHSPATSNQ